MKYWYADPFVCKIENKNYIFAEQFDRFKQIGRICFFEINENGLSKPETIISEAFHLSFPNVFFYKSEYYMIPESIKDNSIRVYRMIKDVGVWEMIKRYDIKGCVDTAIEICNDSIILITSKENKDNHLLDGVKIYKISNFPNSDPKLLYESDTYAYNLRNGGNLICINNTKYRISQNNDCDYYGRSFSINRINEIGKNLMETKLKDVNVHDLHYDENNLIKDGTHTYNYNGDYEVVDFKGKYISFTNLFTKLLRHLYK